MNHEAMKRMEDMAAMILKLPVERREEAFAMLADCGMNEEAIQHFQEYVFYYHMFTDPRFYKAVEQTVCGMFMESLKSN